MAICIVLQATSSGPPSAISSPGGYTLLPWSQGDATLSGGQYACPVGSHLVMTIAEVNAMPKAGIPDGELMKETFFLSFGLVMACYLMGKFTGAVLQLIRGDKKDDL